MSAKGSSPFVNILCTLDQHYLEHLEILLVSLHINNPIENFAIHLAHREIPTQALAAIPACAVATFAAVREGHLIRTNQLDNLV